MELKKPVPDGELVIYWMPEVQQPTRVEPLAMLEHHMSSSVGLHIQRKGARRIVSVLPWHTIREIEYVPNSAEYYEKLDAYWAQEHEASHMDAPDPVADCTKCQDEYTKMATPGSIFVIGENL